MGKPFAGHISKQASKQACISLNNQHVKKEESLELHKPSR